MIIKRDSEKLKKILARGDVFEDEYLPAVLDIIKNVKERGNEALFEYTKKFDRFEPEDKFEVPKAVLERSFELLDESLAKALMRARDNIVSFHEKQIEKTWMYEKENGTILGQKVTPLDRVGVYVPGGKAVYPSSVLMNVLPAKVAGVKEIIMVTPAMDGTVNPVVFAAAYLAGVDRVFRVGGAQAVAALAYGTETVPKVDKIVGPGNIYVALAKKMVFGAVDIDMIAGPSEILVIADETADPAYVAADMLSQAEHDELASSIVLTDNAELAEKIEAEVQKQLAELPKKEIAQKSLDEYGAIIVLDSMEEAYELSNELAPEHLELMVAHPMEAMMKIRHAGAIFLGKNTPEPIGDYIAGPNHVLPTGGTARFFSPLGAYDFLKRSSIIYYNNESLQADMPYVLEMAEKEELSAHARSVGIRKEEK